MLELAAAVLRISTPLIFAAMGGIFSERSGVVNIALEGMMLMGAFAMAAGMHLFGHPMSALLLCLLVSLLFASIHAVACVYLRADAIVSGVASNLLALGITEFGVVSLFGTVATSSRITGLDEWSLPWLGSNAPLVLLALVAVPISSFVLGRTRFGLRVRASGEYPLAVRSAGLSVNRLRFCAVLMSGCLAALGGVFLVMDTHYFTRAMTAGRGYVALAAMIFGKWKPWSALGACVLFGLVGIVQGQLQGWQIPPQFVEILPYVLAMIVLAGALGRAIPPAALGK